MNFDKEKAISSEKSFTLELVMKHLTPEFVKRLEANEPTFINLPFDLESFAKEIDSKIIQMQKTIDHLLQEINLKHTEGLKMAKAKKAKPAKKAPKTVLKKKK